MFKKPDISKLIEYLFYAYVFLLPWQTRLIWSQGYIGEGPWEFGTFSLYGTEIIFYVILILTAYNFFKNRVNPFKNIKKIPLLFWFMGILELLAFVSIFYSSDKSVAVYGWLKLLQGMALFFFAVSAKYELQKVFWAIIASGFFQGLLALGQFWFQKTPAFKWLGLPALDPSILGVSVIEYKTFVESLGMPFAHRWLRVHGSLPHPNMIGFFLVVALACCLAVYLTKNYGIKKLLPVLVSILAIPSLVLTFSRSSWAVMLILLFLYWFAVFFMPKATQEQKEKKRDSKFNLVKFTLIFAGIVSIIVLIYPHLFSTRLTQGSRLEKQSNLERLTGYTEAGEIIKDNWYKGVGINNYTKSLTYQMSDFMVTELNLLEEKRKSYQYQPVHNLYVLVLAELGILGFLAFGMIILCMLKKVFVKWRHLFTDFYFAALSFIFISLLIMGLFDHFFWTLYFGIAMFWLILGLLYRKANDLE